MQVTLAFWKMWLSLVYSAIPCWALNGPPLNKLASYFNHLYFQRVEFLAWLKFKAHMSCVEHHTTDCVKINPWPPEATLKVGTTKYFETGFPQHSSEEEHTSRVQFQELCVQRCSEIASCVYSKQHKDICWSLILWFNWIAFFSFSGSSTTFRWRSMLARPWARASSLNRTSRFTRTPSFTGSSMFTTTETIT